jgi:farnesyl-diphosphate farnesyltransferase
VDAFLQLGEDYQLAIADVTKRMGAGMAEFITKEVHAMFVRT